MLLEKDRERREERDRERKKITKFWISLKRAIDLDLIFY